MNNEAKFQSQIQSLLDADTDDFIKLAKIVGLDIFKDFSGTDLSGVNLVNAELRGVDFSFADLSNANLENADLENAILKGTNFRKANLTGANFNNADLREAIFDDAIIRNTIFTNTVREVSRIDTNNISAANLPLPETYEHKWVLLVGIDHYEDDSISNLRVSVSDVRAMYEMLIATGYEPGQTRLLLSGSEVDHQPTRAQILSSLSSLSQAAGKDDLLLFYFSGHGVTYGDKAYILPTDARYMNIPDTSVDIERVKQIIQNSAAKAKVIVLDSARPGAQIGKVPLGVTDEFVQHVFKEAEGAVILTSGRQREVSWEWPEKRQSVFTYYMLEGLRGSADFDKKGFITVGDIYRYLSDNVRKWAIQHGQMPTPTLQSASAGDVVLVTLASSATKDRYT